MVPTQEGSVRRETLPEVNISRLFKICYLLIIITNTCYVNVKASVFFNTINYLHNIVHLFSAYYRNSVCFEKSSRKGVR